MSDERRREIEMERGRHVAARAANLDKIERMEQSGRLKIEGVRFEDVRSLVPYKYVFLFDGAVIYTHHGSIHGPEWPPEALMAVLGLTVNALQLEVPPPRPTHYVSEEGKRYNREMAAARRKARGITR